MRLGLITRCWNEPYINEFVNHYLNEGFDKIYIIDDRSKPDHYEFLVNHKKVEIIRDIRFSGGGELNVLYRRIRSDYDWILVVDADEYVTTIRHPKRTVKEEIAETFCDADYIKIPWVMMAFNGIEKNPKCLLETNIYRWNHDQRHQSYRGSDRLARIKFRCFYDHVPVKCAFKTKVFKGCWDHGPKDIDSKDLQAVDGVRNENAAPPVHPHHEFSHLRENDIKEAFLVCYHYRVVSKEQCFAKISGNLFSGYKNVKAEDLMATDFPEVIDKTLANKSRNRPKHIYRSFWKRVFSYLKLLAKKF